MEKLVSKIAEDKEIIVELDHVADSIPDELMKLECVHDVTVDGTRISVKVPKSGDFRKQISEFFIGKGLIPLAIQEKIFSLEDAFTTITKENVELLAGVGGKS